jgi:hypothetical protein
VITRVRVAVVLTVVGAFGLADAQEPSRSKPVSFAMLEDYDKGEDLAGIEADFRLLQTLEIDTWRGSLGWDDYEPERGEYDFDWLHRFAELAARHRITLRPYLGFTPEWAARPAGRDEEAWNNPPARIADWEAFVSALATALRRHPNVASYEIYNEQNGAQWWDGTAEEYAAVLTSGARAIRARHSGAQVIFGGLVFPDADWVETVCGVAGRGLFQVLPVHAYPETRTPPDVTVDVTVENYLEGLDSFAEAADDHCGPARIWINETGFATVPGRTELDQAIWWVRAVATFLAHPRVEHIGVYEVKDLAPDRPALGDAPDYHLGLTRVDRTKKLAFDTMDLLTDLLDTGTLSVDDDRMRVTVVTGAAGALHHHLFTRPDGDKVLIVWDMRGAPTLSIEVPGISASVEYGIDGRPLAWDAEAAVLTRVSLQPGLPRIFKLLG